MSVLDMWVPNLNQVYSFKIRNKIVNSVNKIEFMLCNMNHWKVKLNGMRTIDKKIPNHFIRKHFKFFNSLNCIGKKN